jgi:amino-acid N-acetyltransferase
LVGAMEVSRDPGIQTPLELVFGDTADLSAAGLLLRANGLPIADIEQNLRTFILAKLRGETVGLVGVEIYGEVALLRSLCVVESQRCKGTGRALVSAMEATIATRGVRDVYLLTTTAARFFEQQGFVEISRDLAPLAICDTSEFRHLCPSSATFMQKSVPGR